MPESLCSNVLPSKLQSWDRVFKVNFIFMTKDKKGHASLCMGISCYSQADAVKCEKSYL